MDFDKQSREGEPCRGVIKKLFPSKRYGFAVCECAKHTGEAHFNYSDLDLPEHERSCLVVGWRIDFNVIEQHKKTDHCDYRAIQVKPVEVMVVQCEVSEVWENEIAILTCRELTGKVIFVTRSKYNGKFESEAVNRRDTCRAAVTWEQMKQKKTFALHCSQDTVSPTTGSPYRPKFKTPEKRPRRSDGHSFSESMLTSSSSGYADDMFLHNICDQSDLLLSHGGHDSGLVSPEDHQAPPAPSRSFTAPVLRVLSSTSTPKTERAGQIFENTRYSASTKTSPHMSHCDKINRANSLGSAGSSGTHAAGNSFNHKFLNVNSRTNADLEDLKNNNSSMKANDTNISQLRSNFSSCDTFKDNRYGASRRNLDREFELFVGSPQDIKRHSPSRSRSPAYSDSTSTMMSLLALNEQSCVTDNAGAMNEPGGYNLDSVFGLYDASRGHDEIDIYSARNQPQNSFRSSWELALNRCSSPKSPE